MAENLAWLQAADPPLAISHADPGNAQIQSLVEDLSDQANAYLVGGITSGDGGALGECRGEVAGALQPS